ncbi:MAG: DegV family protein [Eubacteriaceae bacterium]|nr:DegV family protein [Eubacteriaceae bacterium]
MKKIAITTDSHSGISKEEAAMLGLTVLPMPFDIEGKTYYEDLDITREEFCNILRKGANVSTSQLSPKAVYDMWDEVLKEYESLVYIPISSGLSGSYQTAMALSEEEKYSGRVFVADCGRVSTTMHMSVLDAVSLKNKGYSAEEIRNVLEEYRGRMIMYVSLSTVEYLKKGGRIKPAVATVANILSIKPVMKFDVGVLDVHKKVRGMKKARAEMLRAIEYEIENNFRTEYDRGRLRLLAATSSEKDITDGWVRELEEHFSLPVICDGLSLGVSCHIGPDALGCGLSVIPKEAAE